jgi:imidazolonepropionase
VADPVGVGAGSASREVDLLITDAAEILPCTGDPADPTPGFAGGVAVNAGRIVAVGDVGRFRGRVTVDARACTVLPGFVDAHTHVVFGGSRVAEYAAGVSGRPVPAWAPAGIVGTMEATRATAQEALVEQASARLAEMLAAGTTTVESKSGYGLSPAAELTVLRVNRELADRWPLQVVSTFLGAHAFPPDTEPAAYVDEVVALAGPVGEGALAEYCDVYCDAGYFDLGQTERILRAGLAAGLAPKLHLDAYSHTGAAALAADLTAASADHLNFTTDAELRALSAAGVPGVYLPVLEYAVRHPRPLDPRRVLAAGMELALATDICPGAWVTSMQLAVVMACRGGGLTPAQALRAATRGGAAALGRAGSVGSLQPGLRADLLVLDVPCHEDVAYRLGRNSVRTVVSDGRVVYRRPSGPGPGRRRAGAD